MMTLFAALLQLFLLLQEFFPNNWLRQAALDQARTKHVMLFDIDLIPSKSLYKNLLAIRNDYTNVKKVILCIFD